MVGGLPSFTSDSIIWGENVAQKSDDDFTGSGGHMREATQPSRAAGLGYCKDAKMEYPTRYTPSTQGVA